MNARTLPERLLAADLARQDGNVELAAISELRRLMLELNELATLATRVAKACPQLAVQPLWFDSVRANVGMAWSETDRAANSVVPG